MPFQTTVNIDQAPGNPGDFCSANPRHSTLAGAGQIVAGVGGVIVGNFAWLDPTYTTATNAGAGAPQGIVGREGNVALITVYLAEVGLVVPAGFGVNMYSTGEFWLLTTTVATIGQKVFANNATGAVVTGAAGATIAGATETKYVVWSAGAVGDVIKVSNVSTGA